jgi:hypothetical protein
MKSTSSKSNEIQFKEVYWITNALQHTHQPGQAGHDRQEP